MLPGGFVTFAHFTCQHRCALKDRTKETQSLGALHVGAKSTENGLFLASVTMPSGALRHRRILDVGGRWTGVGVGKRRLYATIFSCDRPRSCRISTERRDRRPSQASCNPCSLPGPSRPPVSTRADSSVFIPALPPILASPICSP